MFVVLNCTRRFLTRYVEVKSCRPLKNHLIYYHFLYELQAPYGCQNMLWKKDVNIPPESYALVNFRFFLLLILSISILVFLKIFIFRKTANCSCSWQTFYNTKRQWKKLSNVRIIDLTLREYKSKIQIFLNKKFSYYHIKLRHYKFACFFQCGLFSALSQFISKAIMSKIWGKI